MLVTFQVILIIMILIGLLGAIGAKGNNEKQVMASICIVATLSLTALLILI